MTDKAYRLLKKRLNETYSLPINNLNLSWLNQLFKIFTSPLKSFPFKIVIPFSFVFALLLYLIFGLLVIRLVSLLQYGF